MWERAKEDMAHRLHRIEAGMAVLDADTAPEPAPECAALVWPDGVRSLRGTIATIAGLAFGPLPFDMRQEEYTEIALFRASLVLNYATGGAPEMTFSARAHAARVHSKSVPRRLAWLLPVMVIDTACGMLRGEMRHCETAWINFRARGHRH